ncbi:MAG: MotA/TolQ/ExbB proton channel family protein [Phycisphaerae bacterium]|jgi:biopolymer transport protein ExbB
MGTFRTRRALWLAILLLGAVAVPALAAPAESGERQSILKIIYDGIEVPTYFIVVGSVVAIALIVEHFLGVRRATIYPAQQMLQARELIENRNFRECLDTLRKSTTFFARTMTAALLHARHGFDAMHEAAVEKSGELSGRMFRKAEFLNIIGNLGPLLGLLGTVWGMIEAFGSLGAGGGQSGAAELASGISKALVNTLLGLALAIVGLGFFGVCRNRIDSLTVSATVETLNLLEYFRVSPTARRSERTPPPAAAQPASKT